MTDVVSRVRGAVSNILDKSKKCSEHHKRYALFCAKANQYSQLSDPYSDCAAQALHLSLLKFVVSLCAWRCLVSGNHTLYVEYFRRVCVCPFTEQLYYVSRLVGTLREATMAPYDGAKEPKRILRSIIAQ